jgi:hypothetical protein
MTWTVPDADSSLFLTTKKTFQLGRGVDRLFPLLVHGAIIILKIEMGQISIEYSGRSKILGKFWTG